MWCTWGRYWTTAVGELCTGVCGADADGKSDPAMETGDKIDAADADGTNDAAFAERASGASMDTAGSGIAADADRSSDAVTETGGSGIAFMHMGTPRNAATQTGAVSDVVTRMGAEIDVATKRGVPSNTATQRGAPRNAEIVTGCKIDAAVEGTIDAAVQAGDKDALKEIADNDDAREGDDHVGGLARALLAVGVRDGSQQPTV